MKYVVDANIIISILIKQNAVVIRSFKKHELHAPHLLKDEIYSNINIIKKKTKLTNKQLTTLIESLLSQIKFHETEEYESFLEDVETISPDINDVAYLTLALHLNCPLWSNDKALRQQKMVKVCSTEEVLNWLS